MNRRTLQLRAAARAFPDRSGSPHAFSPRQSLEEPRQNVYFQPEKMLALAALQDAIALLHQGRRPKNPRQQRLYTDARNWIWGDDDRWPFSFRGVCAVLDIDPDYLRRGLRRWTDAPVTTPARGLEQEFKCRKTYRRAS